MRKIIQKQGRVHSSPNIKFRGYINNHEKLVLNRKKLVFLSIVIFAALQVFSTIQLASSGAKINFLESEFDKLTKFTREKEEKLVTYSSLSASFEKAEYLGFLKPDSVIYVNDQSRHVGALR